MKLNKSVILIFQMFLLFGITPYFSCGVKAQQPTSEETQDKKPQLAFLNYSISKNPNGKVEAQFVNKVITDGRLKDTSNSKVIAHSGAIECIQFDKNNVVLERTYIQNPLKPIVEYVNDDGDLEKRQLDLETAEFSLKLQLYERTVGVKLLLMDASGKPTIELIKTTIPKS